MPPTSLTLRRAQTADERTLLDLAAAFHAEDGHPLRASSPGAIRTLLAGSPLGQIFFLEAAGRAVGYTALCYTMSLEFGGVVMIVDDLYLEPGARGRGLGTEALGQIEAKARAEGVVQLFLEVERANVGARRLYERRGFSVRARHMMEKLL